MTDVPTIVEIKAMPDGRLVDTRNTLRNKGKQLQRQAAMLQSSTALVLRRAAQCERELKRRKRGNTHACR